MNIINIYFNSIKISNDDDDDDNGSNSSEDDKNKLPTGSIIGIVIGFIVFVGVVIFLLVFILVIKKRKADHSTSEAHDKIKNDNAYQRHLVDYDNNYSFYASDNELNFFIIFIFIFKDREIQLTKFNHDIMALTIQIFETRNWRLHVMEKVE